MQSSGTDSTFSGSDRYGGVEVGAAPKSKPNVVPMRTLSDKEALGWLVQRGRIETSAAALARDWRWNSKKVKAHLDRWQGEGHIEVKPGLGGRTVITPIVEGSPLEAPPPALPAVTAGPPAVVRVAALPAPSPAPDGDDDHPEADTAADALPTALEDDAPAPEAIDAVPAPVPPAPEPVTAMPVAVPPPSAPAAASAGPYAADDTTVRETTALLARLVAAQEAAALRVAPAPAVRGGGLVGGLAYLIAVALAGIAAFFSITGMIVLFPGAPTAIVIMGVVMESAKLVTVAFLAHQWRSLAWLARVVLVVLVAGLAAINAAGVYSQLVAAHFGDRATAEQAVETETATLAARTEVQTQTVADLDRRIAQIDAAIAEMTKRGRASGALEAIATQRRQRDALVGQRRQEAETLATLKSDAAAVTARNHRLEIEAAPIMYVAQVLGASTEQAIRLLILMMVLTCDPLALALTAAASRRR